MFCTLHVATDGLRNDGWAERPVKITLIIFDTHGVKKVEELWILGAKRIGSWTKVKFLVTTRQLMDRGISLDRALKTIYCTFKKYNVDRVVCHNWAFSINSLKCNAPKNLHLKQIENVEHFCTMKQVRKDQWLKMKDLCSMNGLSSSESLGTVQHALLVSDCYRTFIRQSGSGNFRSIDFTSKS